MNWFPLHLHSHHSIQDGLSQPAQIAERMVELGYAGTALTDHGVVSGVYPLHAALKSVCKCGHQEGLHIGGECSKHCGCKAYEAANLKLIAGSEFYLCRQDATVKEQTNRPLSHLCTLATDLDGWKRLMKASTTSHRPEHSWYKPRLDVARLASFSGGKFIVFSGHMGSDFANVIFEDHRQAYRARTFEEAKLAVRKGWERFLFEEIEKYQGLFGAENVYGEIQGVDGENLPAARVVMLAIRWAASKIGLPLVATADSHYLRKEDAADQRILLCNSMDTNLQEVQRKLDNEEDVGLGAFFRSNNYHVPSLEEMADIHTKEELANAVLIAERCSTYKLSDKPSLPNFAVPDGHTADSYARELCEQGMARKVFPVVPPEALPAYRAEIDKELAVFEKAGLSAYFLVYWDVIRYVREELKRACGPGRGSAAGCLVAYLLDITGVDPVKAGLWFERFFNEGRVGSMPDIDVDFSKRDREKAMEYVWRTYGDAYVSQITTFGRMQAKSALKDVLRARGRCSNDEANLITKNLPDEAEIADKLQEMQEATGEASIIQWALENTPELLKEWCGLAADGEIEGPYATEFAQAIRMEGTIRSKSRHASALVISPVPIEDVVPMVWDDTAKRMRIGIDHKDAEKAGLVKYDFLGLQTLDVLFDAEFYAEFGHFPGEEDD